MGLESVTYISDLVITNPLANDPRSEGDDHIRNIKKALKTVFPDTSSIVATAATYTAFAAATTSLTIGGTGATAVVAFPGTLDATSSTAAGVKTAGGFAAAKAIFGGTTLKTVGLIQSYVDTATPAGGGTGVGFYIGSAAVGVFIGDGAPNFAAPKGSLYTNTTATTTTTRVYVNTDGSTAWTYFTSAA